MNISNISGLGFNESQSSIRPGDDSDSSTLHSAHHPSSGRNPVFALEMIQTPNHERSMCWLSKSRNPVFALEMIQTL